MCSLCGVLGGRGHWTDRASNPEAFRARAPSTVAAERQRRTRLVNRVLGHYALSLADWPAGAFVLRSHTGKTELVDNLTELWGAAEALAGRACDPLDGDLLAALEES